MVAKQSPSSLENGSGLIDAGIRAGSWSKALSFEKPSLVLSGGNALGAYHLGAWRAFEGAGLEVGWIAGTSIGAITAAIIAGNPPEARTAALESFWGRAAAFDGGLSWLPAGLRAPMQYTHAAAARLLGRPPLFALAPPDLNGYQSSLFQVGAMRALVNELVDFQRLNSGEIRVSILTVDLDTGSEIAFDTIRDRVEIDHLMASAAFVPDFPAVKIGGRLLVDGGLSANLPLHLVLGSDAANTPPVSTCFAIDLFPSAAHRPQNVLQGLQRQTDLMFSSQSIRTLATCGIFGSGATRGAAYSTWPIKRLMMKSP